MTQEEVLTALELLGQLNKVIARVAALHREMYDDPWTPEDGQISEWAFNPDAGLDLIELTWVEDGYPPENRSTSFPLSLLWSDVAAAEAHKAKTKRDALIAKQRKEVEGHRRTVKNMTLIQDNPEFFATRGVRTAQAGLDAALARLKELES